MIAHAAAAMLSLGVPPGPGGALTEVPFTAVKFADEFWAPKLAVNNEKTLWANFRQCEETGRIANIENAGAYLADPSRQPAKFIGYYFNDSDVYKAVEGACYVLAQTHDATLDGYLDGLIEKIARSQREDGYINSYFVLTGLDKRWTNEAQMHETYCMGHLIEAGVAHFAATGKRPMLDVAIRAADHMDATFGPGKRYESPGHEEVELALIKLSRVTGDDRYFRLAQFFLDQRGVSNGGRSLYGEYCQDHIPLREQREVAGHAVRAMYLFSAVADVTATTGDAGYLGAMDSVWADLTGRKMYVTGGIGNSGANEGFTRPYDLPNDTAYAETCATIGLVFWGHRLNLLHADARYFDVLERALYNGVLSGVSLDGESFFYENRLGSLGDQHRRPWYACACCPPNILRLFASLGGYAYATRADAIFVNLYAGGSAAIPLEGRTVTLTQRTRYPWDGRISIAVSGAGDRPLDLVLRIPGWCEGAMLTVAGQPTRIGTTNGYTKVSRVWKDGETVELDLPMPVQRIASNPAVTFNIGRVAMQRGPIVYCLEDADNGGAARSIAIPAGARLIPEQRPDLLGGVTVLTGDGFTVRQPGWDDALYQAAPEPTPVRVSAIPYYAWDNRQAGGMVVWVPETAAVLPPGPAPGITPSASHCWSGDSPLALTDRQEPANSADHAVPRLTFWDHRGTDEWAQLGFDGARPVSGVEVYWFDDEPAGGKCRLPAEWAVEYLDGSEWKAVAGATVPSSTANAFNRASFDRVTTTAIRIRVRLREGFSGGILETRLIR